MSIHPSLKGAGKDAKQRSVMKRTERLRSMLEKGEWKEGDEVFGLPKIKAIKIRMKKEKAEKAETPASGAEGAAAGTAPAAAPAKGAKAAEKK